MARSLQLASVAKQVEWWIIRLPPSHPVATCCQLPSVSCYGRCCGAEDSLHLHVSHSAQSCESLYLYILLINLLLWHDNCQQNQSILMVNHRVTIRNLFPDEVPPTKGAESRPSVMSPTNRIPNSRSEVYIFWTRRKWRGRGWRLVILGGIVVITPSISINSVLIENCSKLDFASYGSFKVSTRTHWAIHAFALIYFSFALSLSDSGL